MLTNKKTIIFLLIIVFLFVLDRFLKILSLKEKFNNYQIFGDLLKFNFVPNYYIAFSIPLKGDILTIFIFLIITSLLFYTAILWQKKEYILFLFLIAISLGAISNLWDRIEFGYVIDYLDLKYFTIFNLADVLIVSNALLLIIYLQLKNK